MKQESIIISSENLEETRKKIDKAFKGNKKVYVLSKNIEFNRKILENKKVSGLIIHDYDFKDKLKERTSGLNHILCNIAKKNNIKIFFDLNELKNKEKLEKSKILSKIKQNIMLLKKSKINFYWINFNKEEKETLFALNLCLGVDTKTAKESLNL
jgi:RNase P/RNase MRP subunit p30